ncbi:integrase, catalytic region, zinc finger, CCHC-type containing protein [Tanacetum coccineum]
MSDNIPFKIQTEIIKRVSDVKSLLRLRSVSKQWKSFIDSPQFIAGYGARKTQPHTLLLRYQEKFQVKYLSVNNDTLTQQQDLVPNASTLMKHLRELEVIGYSRAVSFNTPERSITKILGFGENDEVILETFREEAKQFGIYDSAVEVYNPWSRNIIKYPIYGQRNSFFISSYKETLLLLDHLDSSVYDDDCEVMVFRSDMLSHH